MAASLLWRQRWEQQGERNPPTHSPIPPPPHPSFDLQQVITAALCEDAGTEGDVSTLATVAKQTQAEAVFLAKASGVLAGLAVADEVFRLVDSTLVVEWSACDGSTVQCGAKFGVVKGSARSILVAERVALNFMQRMSGIATATSEMVKAVEGYPAHILETRKTVPGLRLLDKWAVLLGGGRNHRMGLYDMVMIKDNHIAAAGGITAAVQAAQAYVREHRLQVPVEVETRTLGEVAEVLELRRQHPHLVQRIMLDNMTRLDANAPGGVDVSMLAEAVRLVGGAVETEASGNVTLQTVRTIAGTGVTFVSCGALTHSVTALDISLKIQTK
ncbi:hypothetical protein WJX72_008859 [[Myrmecia] bisecta]|uniref:Nicotinate-nucleotide pyrophosphorylase [carboxylating] n=1 Tax=[Myrmecia] bisecta TaxID=41462 RepID=A0AAW1Q0P8_9CHLO